MAKLIEFPGARPADEGEALVVQYLTATLPETYTLFPNLEIQERGRPAYEYDLVVLAPHALYVVEIKRWRGGIQGDDSEWLIGGHSRRRNPWPMANMKARVLKAQIKNRQPTCERIWVEAVVAIVDEQGRLQLRGNCRDQVVRYTDLHTFLMDRNRLAGNVENLRPLRGLLEQTVQAVANGRRSQKLRFGEYEVIETLVQSDLVNEYLARHTLLFSQEQVRLRVHSYQPYAPAEELEARRQIVWREVNALRTIGSHRNLIRLDNFFSPSEDPNLFVEVTEWSEETLRTLLAQAASLPLDRKLELAQGIAMGLNAVHEAKVIHRDLRPEHVMIGRDGQPRLMNFDRARISLANVHTIGPPRFDPTISRAYLAPELDNPYTTLQPSADLYSLGVILYELLTGQLLYNTPEEAVRENTVLGGPTTAVANIPVRLNLLVVQLLKINPAQRPQSADEVLSELQSIRELPSGQPPTVMVSVPALPNQEPFQFQVNDIIDSKYIVQAVMPTGISGQVYKVYDGVFDRVLALKLFTNPHYALDWLTQEARLLWRFDHPNIVKVIAWDKLPSDRPYLVSEFIHGDELTTFTSGAKRLTVRKAVEYTLQLLDALAYLHGDIDRLEELTAQRGELSEEEFDEIEELKQKSWLHRDIKPANLLLSGDTLKVIDFGIAAHTRQVDRTFVGTLGYMPPDISMTKWDTSCDLFAAGIVLYELITGQHPYPNRTPNADDEPTDPSRYVPSLHKELVKLILRAVSVDRNVRYHSAQRFRQDLLALNEVYLETTPVVSSQSELTLQPEEVGRPNYNPYVTRFLTMYSQAQRDNSGTRGLDEVAQLTYVPTRLDRFLSADVLDGRYRLVIITGNAGDGKTAFIRTLEREIEAKGAYIQSITRNSSRFLHQGIEFVTNYDGSQDEGAERANDQVLNEFFAPFAVTPSNSHFTATPNQVHLIAINEGRLIDFFGVPAQRQRYGQLGEVIMNFFHDESAALPNWLQIVDLNQRSVTAREVVDGIEQVGTSIFELQLKKLLKKDNWAACEQCQLRQRCFIKFNVDTLSDPNAGPTIQERLRTLFEVVHLRRQQHITMRDLRSALAWLLLRDHRCEDIASVIAKPPDAAKQAKFLYFNAFAAEEPPPTGRADDRLVALLRLIDPAETANPAIDRSLYFRGVDGVEMLAFESRIPVHQTWLTEMRSQLVDGWEAVRSAAAVDQRRRYMAMVRRLAYFERRDEGWQAMLPYRHFAFFRKVLQEQDKGSHEEVKKLLIQGLSTAEGARNPQLAETNICLRAGQEPKAKIKSFRLFPANDFQVELARPRAVALPYLEYTPDRLLLYHEPQNSLLYSKGAQRAELQVALDVLELLAQIKDGFAPSLNDIRGYFINLVIFKHALAHLPYRKVLLTRDDQTFYQVTQTANAVIELRLLE